MNNASIMREELQSSGFTVFGGTNAHHMCGSKYQKQCHHGISLIIYLIKQILLVRLEVDLEKLVKVILDYQHLTL